MELRMRKRIEDEEEREREEQWSMAFLGFANVGLVVYQGGTFGDFLRYMS
jgi:hypothetical protein